MYMPELHPRLFIQMFLGGVLATCLTRLPGDSGALMFENHHLHLTKSPQVAVLWSYFQILFLFELSKLFTKQSSLTLFPLLIF